MKNIVISGASRGIGKAIALHFAKHKWAIAFCSRKEEKLIELEDELKSINPQGKYVWQKCDVSKTQDLQNFAKLVIKEFKEVNILVNNAGVFLPGNLSDMPLDDFDSQMKTNIYSAFTLTQELLPTIKLSKKAYIVNMCSIAGLSAYPNGGAYNVSKHALTGYSKTLRNELKEFNIAVSTLYPGATLTDSWAGVDLPEERFIKAEDIAQIVYDLYQLSDRTVVEDVVLRPMLGDI